MGLKAAIYTRVSTEEQKLDLGLSLYKIATYNNLSKNQTKRLIQKWYAKSKLSGNYEEYYINLILKVNTIFSPLTTTEFYKTLNNMNISNATYHKLKQNFYIKNYVYNKMIKNAINHLNYENERIEKEIVNSMRDELNY